MSETRRSLALWIGLVLAFSPVLIDLLDDLRDHPGERYTLLAPMLIGLLLLHNRSSRCTRRVGVGLGLLVAALVAQSIGIAGGSWSIARIGLPVGILGVALMTGSPSVPVVFLAFWAIPVPNFIANITSPGAESMLAAGATEVLSRVGIEMNVGGPLLLYGGERLELAATDNGIVTASELSAVGWFMAIRYGRSAGSAAWKAVFWGGAAIVVQPIAVVLCVATLPLGAPELGRFLLTHGIGLALALLALLSHASRRSDSTSAKRTDVRIAD